MRSESSAQTNRSQQENMHGKKKRKMAEKNLESVSIHRVRITVNLHCASESLSTHPLIQSTGEIPVKREFGSNGDLVFVSMSAH